MSTSKSLTYSALIGKTSCYLGNFLLFRTKLLASRECLVSRNSTNARSDLVWGWNLHSVLLRSPERLTKPRCAPAAGSSRSRGTGHCPCGRCRWDGGGWACGWDADVPASVPRSETSARCLLPPTAPTPEAQTQGRSETPFSVYYSNRKWVDIKVLTVSYEKHMLLL